MALSNDDSWDRAFLTGVEHACESYALPLIGGDTISLPAASVRVFGMTALGRAGPRVPDRGGAVAADALWLVGTLGDAAAGLAQLQHDTRASGPLVDIFRRPVPQLRAGQLLACNAHAMMDVSDGLLLDARRMAEASGCAFTVDLATLPLSSAFVAERGGDLRARLFAATGGDDYALLLALPAQFDPATLSLPDGTRMTQIGEAIAGVPEIALRMAGRPVELPERLGFEHKGNESRGFSAPPMGDRP